jgi:HAD superfamily hydrolase (TIGR01509 family)
MSQACESLPAPLPAAVFFDMDGLLLDTESVWFAVETQILAQLGASWLPDDHARLVGSALPLAAEFIADRAGASVTGPQIAQLLLERMREPLRTATVLPGVRELIAELDDAGIPRALVSSSYRVLVDAALEGLAPLTFDAVIVGDEVSHHKPHPEPYLRAASILGLDPVDCVAFEDSPRGADSASAAGCMVIAVPSVAAITPTARRRVVSSVAEIDLAYLRSLFD